MTIQFFIVPTLLVAGCAMGLGPKAIRRASHRATRGPSRRSTSVNSRLHARTVSTVRSAGDGRGVRDHLYGSILPKKDTDGTMITDDLQL